MDNSWAVEPYCEEVELVYTYNGIMMIPHDIGSHDKFVTDGVLHLFYQVEDLSLGIQFESLFGCSAIFFMPKWITIV